MSDRPSDRTDIERQVRAILADIAPEAAGVAIAPDEDLRDALDLDSMDLLNFAVALSKRFGIDIPETDTPRLTTLRGCADYLTR